MMLQRTDLGDAPKVVKALKYLSENRNNESPETLDLALNSLAIAKKVPGSRGQALVNKCTYAIGEIYTSLGQCEKAIPYLEEVTKISPSKLEEPGISMADYWTCKGYLARCYLASGRKDEAKKLAREVAWCQWQNGDEEALLVAISLHDEATIMKLLDDSNGKKHIVRLGKICRLNRRYDLSQLCMERGKNTAITEEEHIEYGLEQTRLYLAMGQKENAAKYLHKMFEEYNLAAYAWSKKQRAVIEVVHLLVSTNLLSDAEKIAFEGSAREKPKLQLLRAHVLAAKGEFAAARSYLDDSMIVHEPETGKKIWVFAELCG